MDAKALVNVQNYSSCSYPAGNAVMVHNSHLIPHSSYVIAHTVQFSLHSFKCYFMCIGQWKVTVQNSCFIVQNSQFKVPIS